ncbi:uncharacterized protein A1O9_01935 [Exophiala aquamarina CBS 119918]|uniref:NAD(P)-binding domain-containing protein n=1 Tax=Exophiala aquamarina CBS 119918 TaxID=1182545 RepID=A0A072PXQ5_9EURO|nr:uncharacterized protein A1O9_01935 [Exophiala aquamarina CBS 119918]KEF60375.1 hypothetical protein A1O9_01935 [Exophiala aquamarina CBS 119918]
MERVLVVGATGNVGISVIIAALRSQREVLAPVRNAAAAERLYQHVGTKSGITTVEVDVTSDDGVQSLVDRVKARELPSFQHVYAAVGVFRAQSPSYTVDLSYYRDAMNINAGAAFAAYRATVPYLLEQGDPNATWTVVTGGAGTYGSHGVTAISQGALFSLAALASRELDKTNVRFNEAYLDYRVEYDAQCEGEANAWKMKASDYAKIYEGILADKKIKGCRVICESPADLEKLRYEPKLPNPNAANLFVE